jgi:hypothetical protein
MVQLAVANLTVSDITVADSPQFNFTFANGADARTTGVMSGFKIVAQWATNTDGVSTPARGRVENCFIEGNDDLVKLANSGASISGCTLWQFGNGAAFQLGWYTKSVSGITVSDIDVIHSETWFGPGDNYGPIELRQSRQPGRSFRRDSRYQSQRHPSRRQDAQISGADSASRAKDQSWCKRFRMPTGV